MSDAFSWSYSVLKNFETCAKRYYHYNVAKDVKEPETDQLREGNQLHKHFENRVKHQTPLPFGYKQYEPTLGKLIAAAGETHAEQKLALTSSFTPTTFFGKAAWFRTVIDFTKINGKIATVVDYKTGAVKDDSTQLQLMAATIFAYDPGVDRVKTAFWFVAHGQLPREEYTRSDLTEIWGEILPRVKLVERARAAQHYPPTPSGLCKRYCAVSSCPHHGR